jgi:tRNA 2-selenouridine synthase
LPALDIVDAQEIDRFQELIDVRSPAEFADDHIPGASNYPVLDDVERAEVGTLNAQVSPFAARRRGAVLAARNIAGHVEQTFSGRDVDWHPLVYCWRGGKRSRSMALVLAEIGWRVSVLRGGYKSYRREVMAQLAALPAQQRCIVICGETGTAKSALLRALAARGAQVLDLEHLARHRGSVLGDDPLEPQPSQRSFETLLWSALRSFDPRRPVFVESESRKVGDVQLPEGLIGAMRASECVRLSAPLAARVRHLLVEYRRFIEDPAALAARIDLLRDLYSHTLLERWKGQVRGGEAAAFVAEILSRHYDPAYSRSMARNFPRLEAAAPLTLDTLEEDELDRTALQLLRRYGVTDTPQGSANTLTC